MQSESAESSKIRFLDYFSSDYEYQINNQRPLEDVEETTPSQSDTSQSASSEIIAEVSRLSLLYHNHRPSVDSQDKTMLLSHTQQKEILQTFQKIREQGKCEIFIKNINQPTYLNQKLLS